MVTVVTTDVGGGAAAGGWVGGACDTVDTCGACGACVTGTGADTGDVTTGFTSSTTGAVTSPRSGASLFRLDLSTLAYSSSTGDRSDKSLSELHGSVMR